MRLRPLAGLAALALFAGAAVVPAYGQSYPTNSPVYVPSAIGAAQSIASTATLPASITWQVNGVNTVGVNVTGTYTGLVATIQAAADRSASPTWVTVGYVVKGGARSGSSAIAANGLYVVNTAGMAQLRLNVTALSTGSVSGSFSATPGGEAVLTTPNVRTTYSATTVALATAASATDFYTLTGSATKTVRVTRAYCSGSATTAASAVVALVKRTTADTGGTSSAPTIAQHDSGDVAPTAVVAAYTVNPTTGTSGGTIRGGVMPLQVATVAATQPGLNWDFGGTNGPGPIILRGIAQQLAFNGNGATLGTGAAATCTFEWIEE